MSKADIVALADRIAVEDTLTRYFQHFESSAATAAFVEYYTDDAVLDVNGLVATGRAGIAAMYAYLSQIKEAPMKQGVYRVIISNPLIEVNGAEATATVMWTGIVNNGEVSPRPTLVSNGLEHDLLVKRDGKWLIKKRVVITESPPPSARPEHVKNWRQPA